REIWSSQGGRVPMVNQNWEFLCCKCPSDPAPQERPTSWRRQADRTSQRSIKLAATRPIWEIIVSLLRFPLLTFLATLDKRSSWSFTTSFHRIKLFLLINLLSLLYQPQSPRNRFRLPPQRQIHLPDPPQTHLQVVHLQ